MIPFGDEIRDERCADDFAEDDVKEKGIYEN